jgi:hypothetical protein
MMINTKIDFTHNMNSILHDASFENIWLLLIWFILSIYLENIIVMYLLGIMLVYVTFMKFLNFSMINLYSYYNICLESNDQIFVVKQR